MSDRDFAIGSVGIPAVGHINKKPCYLVELTDITISNKALLNFLAIDKPEPMNGFIQVKGFYSSLSEDKIVKTFSELVAATAKENILDLMLPIHRVYSIRSLVFNANKPSSLVK